ncbi:MAG: tRNA 2-selenouridine(34) synthase MnmH, partial [Burkholderiales bacterium]|nr:tRNA 2-selenouridine(34) synthase MnmH [Burkholderiales bacterium]
MDVARLGEFDAILDARSPAEFAEDHIPGAASYPVLSNEERARVGAIHKQESPFAAKKLGASLVAKNIAFHIETALLDKPKAWRPLVYCWRGGKRSGAFAHVLREIGWDAKTLAGGYKAYRRHVVERLAALPDQLRFRVVHGVTGSGKSRLLAALAAAGAQVLDLEALAAHRGSVLGGLPQRPQPSQKMFESLLLETLQSLRPEKEIFVEGESKKIGQLQVPDALIARMRASECVLLDTANDARVALLMDEYRHFFADLPALNARLDCLAGLHGREKVGEWKALAAEGRWADLVARLLEEHYDPAYRRSAARNFARLAEAPSVRMTAGDSAAFATAASG